MTTQLEKLRSQRAKKEEVDAKVAMAAQAALTPPSASAPLPPGIAGAPGPQVQLETLKVTIVGVLKQRDENGEEKGVSQTIDLQIPKGFPKKDYEKLMAQVWNVITKQVGGLQNTNDDGSFTFYKDDLFERYGATIHEVVGVTIG